MWGRNSTVWESEVDTGKLFSLLGYLHNMLTYTSFSTDMNSLKNVLMGAPSPIWNVWGRSEQVSGKELSVCLLHLAVLRLQTGLWNFKL